MDTTSAVTDGDGLIFHYRAGLYIGGTGPSNVNLGPPKISETTRPRMSKLKTQLDIVKYSLWIQKFLC